METANWAVCALAALDVAVYAFLMILSFVALRSVRRAPRRHVDRAPRITIFKPLAGADDDLVANLESFATLDYPSYELLFGVASIDDPAYETARAFVRRHPELGARVILTDANAARNPKVAQLVSLAERATGELFVISDSNVRVPQNYLWSLVAEIARPGVGLVTSAFAGTGEASLGAALENLQLATVVAPATILANAFTKRPLTIGKSMAMWRRDLAQIGGFRAFANVLAEDHVLGDEFLRAGFSIRTSLALVENRNVDCSTRRTLERHARWSKIRRSLSLGFFFEPLSCPLVLTSLLLAFAPSRWLVMLVATSALLQTVFAMLAVRALRGTWLSPRYLPLEVARSFAIFGCWAWALVSDRVVWRGHPFRILKGSRIVPAQASVWSRAKAMVKA